MLARAGLADTCRMVRTHRHNLPALPGVTRHNPPEGTGGVPSGRPPMATSIVQRYTGLCHNNLCNAVIGQGSYGGVMILQPHVATMQRLKHEPISNPLTKQQRIPCWRAAQNTVTSTNALVFTRQHTNTSATTREHFKPALHSTRYDRGQGQN